MIPIINNKLSSVAYRDVGSLHPLIHWEDEHTLGESPRQRGGRRRPNEVFMDFRERECPLLARLRGGKDNE